MRVALVGHRGVGKSSYLQSLSEVFPELNCFDLDREIERFEGRSVKAIFSKEGEKHFRFLEQDCLNALVAAHSHMVVSLGAGFSGVLPDDFQVIWLRRETDSAPRVFFDRPRLNSTLLPSEEYLDRYSDREKKYAQVATRQVFLPEGDYYDLAFVKRSFLLSYPEINGALTLLPEHLEFVLKNKSNIGAQLFEVRSDFFSEQEFQAILENIDLDKILLAYRPKAKILSSPPKGVLWDWDLSLGSSPFGVPPIVSSHENQVDVRVLQEHSKRGSHVKVSPEVKSWEQLIELESLLEKNLKSFSLLPRTSSGQSPRWSSYRLFSKFKLNFFRIDQGSASDQPTIESFVEKFSQPIFAAVLGDPILHSFSPSFHKAFFESFGMPFYPVNMKRGELTDSMLRYLHKKGMRFAALTSPCKKDLLNSTLVELDLSCLDHQSLNTLIWSEKKGVFLAFNTDTDALLSELAEFNMDEALIWGAGAMGQMIHEYYPDAVLESARMPGVRKFSSVKTVVWSAGDREVIFPSVPQAQRVYDLSYTQFSKAREFALLNELQYTSGKEMFEIQAKLQQDLWLEYGQQ